VRVCVLHFTYNNQYEARRLGEFAGSEKHAPRLVFIFSRLQYSKYLAAVRVTKGDQMWQRWAPVPPICLYVCGLQICMTLDDMHINGMPSS
jgi:hypothetical protein